MVLPLPCKQLSVEEDINIKLTLLKNEDVDDFVSVAVAVPADVAVAGPADVGVAGPADVGVAVPADVGVAGPADVGVAVRRVRVEGEWLAGCRQAGASHRFRPGK